MATPMQMPHLVYSQQGICVINILVENGLRVCCESENPDSHDRTYYSKVCTQHGICIDQLSQNAARGVHGFCVDPLSQKSAHCVCTRRRTAFALISCSSRKPRVVLSHVMYVCHTQRGIVVEMNPMYDLNSFSALDIPPK
jgi:hypothetical protein